MYFKKIGTKRTQYNITMTYKIPKHAFKGLKVDFNWGKICTVDQLIGPAESIAKIQLLAHRRERVSPCYLIENWSHIF